MTDLQRGESADFVALTELEPACADALDKRARVRFWRNVQRISRGPRAGCWLWTGSRHPFGHGRFLSEARGGGYAHRIAWRLLRGEIPAGKQVNHHCDEPSCVNPDHLYIGTQRDNLRDARTRGRMPKAHAGLKMTAAQVVECRMLRQAGWAMSPLAHRYSVSKALVSMICSGHRRSVLLLSTLHATKDIAQLPLSGAEVSNGALNSDVRDGEIGAKADIDLVLTVRKSA